MLEYPAHPYFNALIVLIMSLTLFLLIIHDASFFSFGLKQFSFKSRTSFHGSWRKLAQKHQTFKESLKIQGQEFVKEL